MFSAPLHPSPSAGFELESPRGSFGGDPLASPNFHYGGSASLQVGAHARVSLSVVSCLRCDFEFCHTRALLERESRHFLPFHQATYKLQGSTWHPCLGTLPWLLWIFVRVTLVWLSKLPFFGGRIHSGCCDPVGCAVRASCRVVQGFTSVPQSPSAAQAELAMWQLASRMGSLNMQQALQPQQPQQSPFAGADRSVPHHLHHLPACLPGSSQWLNVAPVSNLCHSQCMRVNQQRSGDAGVCCRCCGV
jgi:hypothetical protein